ncbi:hypothetical protein [Afipia sp. GAS231]|nr:hypothetical protein [Afipia sp. GAS231]
MTMTLHIANYEIVLAPAGMVALAVLVAIVVLGVAAVVRIVRRRSRP